MSFMFIVDTFSSSVSSTVDTTKGVASAVVDKGSSFLVGAKGIKAIFTVLVPGVKRYCLKS